MGGVEQMETRDWLKQNRKSEHVQIWSWGDNVAWSIRRSIRNEC